MDSPSARGPKSSVRWLSPPPRSPVEVEGAAAAAAAVALVAPVVVVEAAAAETAARKRASVQMLTPLARAAVTLLDGRVGARARATGRG